MPATQSTPALVIYNGPSQLEFRGIKLPDLVIGCNMAYLDWSLTHCWAVDRMTVAKIVKDLGAGPYDCEFWTKRSVLPLPPNWQHQDIPGIDSGSAAVNHSLQLTSGPVYVIGADGVCGQETTTIYEQHYLWHGRGQKKNIHQRHKQSLAQLTKQHPGRIRVAWDQPVEGLEIIPKQELKSLFS